jgi:UDP-N-acetylglucosamine--N-acetylmuramyl-(pentapeptide) pyrophosphoryl-undecaprenol N-acetylglucosamine transferase
MRANEREIERPFIAIACGGTGGHLFPGIAIGEALGAMGADVTLIISEKEVDQNAVKSARGMDTFAVPAVASTASKTAFVRGMGESFKVARSYFQKRRPDAVLAMGGFTSAGPILAGKSMRIPAFLHEANSIPGRANRMLAPLAREVFVMFQGAANRLNNRRASVMGMPVRSEFQPGDPGAARMAIGLDPDRDTVLIMGGSQGATAINEAAMAAIPKFLEARRDLQFLHLTGLKDIERCAEFWRESGARAVVTPFLSEMDMGLSAATVAISRSGASSLAEFAAMRLPAILVPLPSSADDHQVHNARAFAQSGAAQMMLQPDLKPETLVPLALDLIDNSTRRARMVEALAQWHAPDCADKIARRILSESAPRYSIPLTNFISALAA